MSKQGLQANVIPYSATINACGKGRQWQRALGLVDKMRADGLQPAVITFRATSGACSSPERQSE